MGAAAGLLSLARGAWAQQTDSSSAQAYWAGLMTDWQLHGPWALWFDTHYNTRAFVVLRGGLTHHFKAGPSVTGGYAHLWTQPGGFERNEHRPWAQLFFPFHFSDRFSVSHRLRFDLRVRERIADGELVSGWVTTPRWRSQTALNLWFGNALGGRWFSSTALEVLVNGGSTAGPNYLDQNRASLMLGYKLTAVTVRAGYLHRFVPGATGLSPVHEHNAVLWLNYKYRQSEPVRPKPATPEAANP